jgi:hypothetical protein
LLAVQAERGGEVEVVSGVEAEEVAEQRGVADDAELAAEFLLLIGYGAGVPLPPPVREGAVQHVPNHEDVVSSEHQIRLSKGLIAKFVQGLELGADILSRPNEKATAMVAFVFPLL